jgi:sugar phosphate isomerase/epimerase
MSRAIVGYTGFVGSNLLQFYKFDYFYNSKNFSEASNMTFDELYFCGVPAVKWKANKYPQEDIDVIDSIKEILKTIKVNRIVLISTIDVYEDVDRGYTEDYDCDWVINHHYGRNRYMFEYFVKNNFENYNIIRLPALFGKGLKKNVIYDLMNNNQIDKIPINSLFQWYDLNWLKNDIDLVIENDIKICNFFTEPIQTREITNLFNYDANSYYNNEKEMIYNCKTKYTSLFNCDVSGYIRNKGDVLKNIKSYVETAKINTSRLCVSNICIKHISQFQFACVLKLYGIKNVQIAPTTLIGDWKNIDTLDVSMFTDNGINVYSFQSIAYGLNDLNIFSSRSEELMTHLKKVVNCASRYGVKILVFGCPRNRKIIDIDDDNDTVFIKFFRELGEYCKEKNVIICIEPNAKEYGCNYLNKVEQGGVIVNKIDNSNIKLMVDLGNIIMENDDISLVRNYSNVLHNIDVAQPNMLDLSIPHELNASFVNTIKDIGYNNNINLEMILNAENSYVELILLSQSLSNFIQLYSK